MAERHVRAAQAPRPRRRARADYKARLIQETRDAVPGWQNFTATALSAIIARRLENKRPGGWLPATIRVYLRRLANHGVDVGD